LLQLKKKKDENVFHKCGKKAEIVGNLFCLQNILEWIRIFEPCNRMIKKINTLRKSLASIWISLGKVAENIRVCLTSGPGMLS
jgi:hypothetical protein